jgi:hypothetical protein
MKHKRQERNPLLHGMGRTASTHPVDDAGQAGTADTAGLPKPERRLRLIRVGVALAAILGLTSAGAALLVPAGSDQPTVGASVDKPRGGGGSGGSAAPADRPGTTAYLKDGVQHVGFDLRPGAYAPITIQKGLPVKWTINATKATLNGCNGELTVPQLGLRKKLQVGVNTIEFTAPATAGTVGYTCWMGMISSTIQVVDKLPETPAAIPGPPVKSGVSGSPAGGCGMPCCGG